MARGALGKGLRETVDLVLATAADHKRVNESNTRVLLIEPILDALGWDTRNLAVVTREVPVHDGTFIDYALLIEGKAALFVEAKALGTNLADPKVVSQTVNYANGGGVPWCVLTDGVRWRVFWTLAPVAMDRKGVFDVDLSVLLDDGAGQAEREAALHQLGLLSRQSVEAGQLDQRGRSLFDAGAVRVALDRLFTDPPDELVALVADRLDYPLEPDRIRPAVAHLGRPFLDAPPTEPTPPAPAETKAPTKYSRIPHTYEEHFGGRPQAVVDLYQRFHEAVMAKGDRIQRSFKAKAVNYAVDGRHIFVTVVPQAGRLKLFLVLPGSRADGHDDLRDMTGIGHHGYGDIEAPLTADNLEDRLRLVDEALAVQTAAGHQPTST